MIGKFLLLVTMMVSVVSGDNNMLAFYKEALKTLFYYDTYILEQKSKALQVEVKKRQRYLNLDADMIYGVTNAKLLPHHFNNIDIGVTNTIDLFGKNMVAIHLIQLQMKENMILMQVQKEKLFLSLLSMVAAYRSSEEKWLIFQKLYQTQLALLKATKSAVKAGTVPMSELIRIENVTALVKVQKEQEAQIITMMKAQLKLYSPHLAIPQLSVATLHCDLPRFLANSPQLKLSDNRAMQASQKIKQIKQSWMPDAIVGVNQQFNNDPTANGDNYTLSMGLHMYFHGGRSYELERQKVDVLSIKSREKILEIERKAQYIRWKTRYQIAKNSFISLSKTLKNTDKTLKNIKIAYLRRYIDLNTYLQTLKESIATYEAQITAKYMMIENAVILNTLSKGLIYD